MGYIHPVFLAQRGYACKFVWNCHREREQGRISQGFMPSGAAATHDFFGNSMAHAQSRYWWRSQRGDETLSSSMGERNSLLHANKEVFEVTQISANPTSSRRNGSCGPRCLSQGQCLHAGA